jgi:hypothetical protein
MALHHMVRHAMACVVLLWQVASSLDESGSYSFGTPQGVVVIVIIVHISLEFLGSPLESLHLLRNALLACVLLKMLLASILVQSSDLNRRSLQLGKLLTY